MYLQKYIGIFINIVLILLLKTMEINTKNINFAADTKDESHATN